MKKYKPEDGTWIVSADASNLSEIRNQLGKSYDEQKRSIQNFLCDYFSTGSCDNKLGKSVSPLGATAKGGKILKVRWMLPGEGKSGGLRLIVVAYCDEKKVVVAEIFKRRDNPSDKEIKKSLNSL